MCDEVRPRVLELDEQARSIQTCEEAQALLITHNSIVKDLLAECASFNAYASEVTLLLSYSLTYEIGAKNIFLMETGARFSCPVSK